MGCHRPVVRRSNRYDRLNRLIFAESGKFTFDGDGQPDGFETPVDGKPTAHTWSMDLLGNQKGKGGITDSALLPSGGLAGCDGSWAEELPRERGWGNSGDTILITPALLLGVLGSGGHRRNSQRCGPDLGVRLYPACIA